MKRGRPRLRPEDKKTADYWAHARPDAGKPRRVEIMGRTFEAVPVQNKTSCRDCDILKMRPPQSPASLPLCYEVGAAHGHAVVQICRGHQMIWKEI